MTDLSTNGESAADSAIEDLRRAGTVVLGIALEVPQPWGEELQQWRLGFGDNTADHMPTHITLWPPTKLPAGTLDSLMRQVTDLCAATAQFPVATAGIASFRPVSPVVFLSIGDGSESLARIHRGVQTFIGDVRPAHPYVPHITVAFHLPDSVLDAAESALGDFEVAWTATHISSFLRGRDGRWVPLARHLLAIPD